MSERRLILASSSPFRKALLERLLLPFDTANPDIDDSPGRFTLYTDIVSQFGCRYSDTKALVK